MNRELGLAGDEALRLKTGLHVGPCLLVTLNGRLDYFGTVVNVAARILRLAAPGEIVMTEQIRADALEGPLRDVPMRREMCTLRGLEDRSFEIWRVPGRI